MQITSKISRTMLVLLSIPLLALSQSAQQNMWVPNGEVYSVVEEDGIVYIGGTFTQVAPYTGGFVLVDSSTAARDTLLPRIHGSVYSMVPDGSGGWFVGGVFSKIGNVERHNIVHVKSDKTVDGDWNPNADGAVQVLAVSGSTVYAGGSFTNIGGVTRNSLAALDASTGIATVWNPNPDGQVYSLAVSGSTVYVGGYFTSIGDSTRKSVAEIDLTTAKATNWNPDAGTSIVCAICRSEIRGIPTSGAVLYLGGSFTTIGDSIRNKVAAVDTSTGMPTSWDPNANNNVLTLAVSGSTVYVGGYFTSIGGQSRNYVAALDATTGYATSWDPSASSLVNSVMLCGSSSTSALSTSSP